MEKVEKVNRVKHNMAAIGLALVAVVLLSLVILTLVTYIHNYTKEESFEKLHLETRQIKDDINLQMLSDRENLMTMSNFAAKLHEEGKDYSLLFESFEKIGLFDHIKLLNEDGYLLTKGETLYIGDTVSFEEEAKKGTYISGRVYDLTDPEKQVVRSAVPVVTSDGKTVAVIYGVIELHSFKERYLDDVEAIDADVLVIEAGNGNYVLDTNSEELGNIAELATVEFHEGYSYNILYRDISSERNGFTAFVSDSFGETLYAHYAPLEFADWQIMLMKRESVVFAVAHSTANYMIIVSCVIIIIMLCYILTVIALERKNLNLNANASIIRKKLLGINSDFNNLHQALERITIFSKARSTIFIDSNGEDFYYIMPNQQEKMLLGDDKEYFKLSLFNYVAKQRKEYGATVYISKVKLGNELRNEMPSFCDFMEKHNIKTIHIAVIRHNNSNTSLLCVVNSKKTNVNLLLKDIAICFSMALYNNKHLATTQVLALTDALTGVANRLAYKNDVKGMSKRKLDKLICIYIDVNELNFFNNKYGHAAGDQMLVFIAETLQKEFADSKLYRMGGDEFLIFTEGISFDEVKERISKANSQIEEMKYHISVGIKKMEESFDIEKLITEAEKIMYNEKAQYYQSKDTPKSLRESNKTTKLVKTGIKNVDACLSIMSMRYIGMYCVSLKNDEILHVLSSSYYSKMPEHETKFSDIMKQYIQDVAKPEYGRNLLNFLEYDVMEKELEKGNIPSVVYEKNDGEKVRLSIYPIYDENEMYTVWTFEKIDINEE